MRRPPPSIASRAAAVALAAGLLLPACGGPTTPEGALGEPLDFRSSLPPGVKAPATDDPSLSRHTQVLEIGPGAGAVELELEWSSFQAGRSQYLADVELRVVRSGAGTAVSVARVGSPINVGTLDAPVEMIQLGLQWSRREWGGEQRGTHIVALSADGKLTHEPGEGS